MKQNIRNDNKYSVMMGAIAIAIGMIVFVYSLVSRNQMEEYVHHAAQGKVKSVSNAVDAYISSALNSIKLTSYMMTQNMTAPTIENVDGILTPLESQTSFDFIEYINRDGMNCTNQGEWFDASDREYYIQGIQGNTGIWINYSPEYSDEYLLNFYTPLYYEEEIVGVVTGVFCADDYMLPLLETDFFGKEMYGILCDEKGQIIVSNFDAAEDTLLEDVLRRYGVPEKEIQSFCRQFEKADGSVFHIKVKSSEMAVCIKQNEQTGWRVVQIIPPASIRSVMRQNTVSAYLMIVAIAVLLLLFVFYMRADLKKRHRQQLDAKERVVKNYEQILTLVAPETYKAVRRLELDTERADYIYFENGQVHQIDVGDWMTWLARQEKNVHPDDYKRLKTFLHIDNIRRMEEGVTLQESYRSATKNEYGYYNTYFSTVTIAQLEGQRVALIASIDNTKAVMNELEQKRWLSSAASIYISMHALDLKNNTWEVLKTTDMVTDALGEGVDNVADRLMNAMRKLTDEQYLETMMKFVDLQTLDERMKEGNTITFEYVGASSNWRRARFIAVDYDENDCLSHVLFVIENIDAEKRKANRLLYLSETDLMTGIRNRGSGEKKIKELLAANQAGMFCLLDVDKFKDVNDTFGHGVGDKVLIEIARCLKESFRDTDVVMRLGGDEFAVFAKGIITKGLVKAAFERFFEKLEQIDIPELGHHKISVSVGVVLKYEEDGLDFESLYHNADLCTYESKKNTGNTFTIYE